MRILAVDTTTWTGSVALLEDAKLVCEVNWESRSSHASRLLSSVDHVLEAGGIQIRDVDGFAVAVGPGSFTGIRIGLSTVKALAFASRKPVAAVSTLRALALKLAGPRTDLLCPALDAKKGEIYAALYQNRAGELAEAVAQGAYAPADFFRKLRARGIIHFIGTGADVYRAEITDALGEKARFSRRSPFIGYEVGRLGYEELKNGRGLDGKDVEPLYFRKSQAEEKH